MTTKTLLTYQDLAEMGVGKRTVGVKMMCWRG